MTKKSAAISPKPKRKPRGKAFEPGNPWRWPKGVSGNPSGRPATVSGAYKAWLELPYDKDPTMTNAQAMAVAQGFAAHQGDVQAAKEIRQATEGDTQHVDGVSITITYADNHSDAAEATPGPAANQTGA